jgi:hypothetical protein
MASVARLWGLSQVSCKETYCQARLAPNSSFMLLLTDEILHHLLKLLRVKPRAPFLILVGRRVFCRRVWKPKILHHRHHTSTLKGEREVRWYARWFQAVLVEVVQDFVHQPTQVTCFLSFSACASVCFNVIPVATGKVDMKNQRL